MSTDDLLGPLLQAIPHGVPEGTDLRRIVLTNLLEWDEDSTRGLVAIDGGDSVWLPGAADTYWPDAVGYRVMVLRNEWTGKAACILGPIGHFPYPDDEVSELPGRGTVTSVPGNGRVVVSAGGESHTAQTVLSYASPSSGDKVALVWDDGSPVAIGEIGAWSPAAPTTPPRPDLSRSKGTVTVSFDKPSSVSTTRVRYRYGGSGGWTVKKGVTGTSTTIGISEGRTRQVQIARVNAGGVSPWSDDAEITYPQGNAPPKPSKPKYETVTATISPTFTGTYRAGSTWNRWNGTRYGGFETLYQGNKYGSGELTGLATYGSRVKDLRATEILKVEVRLVDANPGVYDPGNPIRVQVSPHGSRPGGSPSTGGASQTTNLGKNQSKWLNLGLGETALNGFRDGDLRGLVVNGGPYRGLRGRGTSGMTLRVTYKRKK